MSSNYWEPPKNNLALEINNLSKIYNNEDNDIEDEICEMCSA